MLPNTLLHIAQYPPFFRWGRYLGGTVLTDEYHERMEQFVSKEEFEANPNSAMKKLFPHQ
jgi:hypothetical protein